MIKCPYCNKNFKTLTGNHLKSHGISVLDYLKEYNPEKYYYEYVSNWILSYYSPYKTKFIEQIYNKKTNKYAWTTILTCATKEEIEASENDENKKRKYTLNKSDIIQHLKKGGTIGVFAHKFECKW